jgi:hypothetical protein
MSTIETSTAGDINERSCASQQNWMLDVRFVP